MIQSILDTDKTLFQWINTNSWHNSWLDGLMIGLSSHVTWAAVLIFAITASIWRVDRQALRRLLLVCIAVAVGDAIAGNILKPWFGRLRPCHEMFMVVLPTGKCGGQFGFPSNHALNAGIILGVLYSMRAGWPVLLCSATLAFLVAFSRVWLGVHYPADVIVGLFSGATFGFLFGKIVSQLPAKVQRPSDDQNQTEHKNDQV